MRGSKDKTLTVLEAIDKINCGEWLLVEDVKALVKNEYGQIVFFTTEDLTQFINQYRRYREKGRDAKAENQACLFTEWMLRQLEHFKMKANPDE